MALVNPSLAVEGGRSAPYSELLTDAIPSLRAYARRLIGTASVVDAEDLVQEVFARALRYRANFDPERPVLPWLKRMTLHTYIDLKARRDSEALPEDPAAPHARDAVAENEALEKLLEPLTEQERSILTRFHAKAESIREIAADLGLPEGTVKSHLHRARKKAAEGGAQ